MTQSKNTFRKTLVIDNSTLVSIMLKSMVSIGQVFVANDGFDGLRKALWINPDLILMDICLPRMNGVDFLYFLRNMNSIKGTPVIVVTGLPFNEYLGNLRKKYSSTSIRINGFVTKPIKRSILKEKIDMVFAGERLTEDNKDIEKLFNSYSMDQISTLLENIDPRFQKLLNYFNEVIACISGNDLPRLAGYVEKVTDLMSVGNNQYLNSLLSGIQRKIREEKIGEIIMGLENLFLFFKDLRLRLFMEENPPQKSE